MTLARITDHVRERLDTRSAWLRELSTSFTRVTIGIVSIASFFLVGAVIYALLDQKGPAALPVIAVILLLGAALGRFARRLLGNRTALSYATGLLAAILLVFLGLSIMNA